ncbi:AbrB/MazE/SpoVT family DNA-binding domain-containing protein [bacterium]|nr:AbrB/MazE/SpoVT family DNA-binding domain-containing protein [bacterium]
MMNLVKVRDKYQITIPEYVRKKTHCEVGELLNISLHGNEIVLKPMTVEEKYSENEINALEKIFKSSHNRSRIMSAGEFKKHQEKL